MKKVFSIKKVVALTAVACCLITATAFAAGTISSYTSTSNRDTAYTELPNAKKMTKELGFTPKMMENFSNGYSFEEAIVSQVEGQSDTGEKVSEFNELNTDYRSADGQSVTMIACHSENAGSETLITQTENYNGIDLNYSSQVFKFVPEDYQLTAEDQEAQANGSIAISYGSDEVEITTCQFTSWTDGDGYYTLMTENAALSAADLFGMAKEVIDMK